MTANHSHALTQEQLFALLKSSYCLINNWGGQRFHYIPTLPEEHNSKVFNLLCNDSGKTYKFNVADAKIVQDESFLRVINSQDDLPYTFVVLSKLNLYKFIDLSYSNV